MEVMYPRCAGLDAHKETVVACVRIVEGGDVSRSVRTFATTTASLIELGEWLEANGCTHVAMEATGVYWKPVWQVLVDSSLELVLANADSGLSARAEDRPAAAEWRWCAVSFRSFRSHAATGHDQHRVPRV